MSRFLFVTEGLNPGGAERVALGLIESLVARGHLVDLLACGGPGQWDEQLPPQVRLTHASNRPDGRFRQALWASGRALLKLAPRADVIVALHPNTALLLRLLGPWCGKAKRVGWVHFDASAFLPDAPLPVRLAIRCGYRGMDACVFVSEPARTALEDVSGPLPHTLVIPNPLTTRTESTPASATPSRMAASRAAGLANVVFVGRLVKSKQPDHAVAVSQLLVQQGIPHRLYILGDGPERHRLANLARTVPSVELAGEEHDVPRCLAQAQALILTSRYEAWPTVILEAMAQRIPVISYDCPSGPRLMLASGERGHLVPPDPVAMAKCLAEVLRNPGAEASRLNAAAAFADRHAPTLIADAWESLLRTWEPATP